MENYVSPAISIELKELGGAFITDLHQFSENGGENILSKSLSPITYSHL